MYNNADSFLFRKGTKMIIYDLSVAFYGNNPALFIVVERLILIAYQRYTQCANTPFCILIYSGRQFWDFE